MKMVINKCQKGIITHTHTQSFIDSHRTDNPQTNAEDV